MIFAIVVFSICNADEISNRLSKIHDLLQDKLWGLWSDADVGAADEVGDAGDYAGADVGDEVGAGDADDALDDIELIKVQPELVWW